MTAVPVKFAQIEWEDDDRRRVTEVLVFDRRSPPDEDPRHELLTNSGGACVSDWMTGEDPRATPEGVFVQMARVGFATPDAMLQALEEFAKIDTCQWAGAMAAALQRRLKAERQ